jgi:hypothetical protein
MSRSITAVVTGDSTVKTLMLIAGLAGLLSGCATVGGVHALATPWGAGAMYSFKDASSTADGERNRTADRQVARALDAYEQPTKDDVRVASR